MSNIKYIFAKNTQEKFELMEFVYKNTDSFIMNTFGYVWENRGWWDKFPIATYMLGDKIVGLHAFTVDTKAPDTIKTYYIITGKSFRGMGIGKKLIMDVLGEYSKTNKKYFVNSEESSDGVKFFKHLFENNFKIEINEFDTVDYLFEDSVSNLYNRLNNEKKI